MLNKSIKNTWINALFGYKLINFSLDRYHHIYSILISEQV